jgi:hypothetical protein
VKSLWLKKDFNFITSGYTKNGTDLERIYLKAPKIALLSGKGVPLNLAVWFYLDEVIGYP